MTKTRRNKRSITSSRRISRRTCVRSLSPLMSPKDASLFCQEAWLRGQNQRSRQVAGAMPNTLSLFLNSPNISKEDRQTVDFLWSKHEEFKKDQITRDKRWIASTIWSVLQYIRLSYANNTSTLYSDPKLLATLGFLFDELLIEFEERVENPVKSCKLLPGRYGRPMVCPEKNSATLQKCISDYKPILKEAKRLRRAIYTQINANTHYTTASNSSNGFAFIEKVMEFFRSVQGSDACLSFERLDNFAKNKGKYMKGHIALFKILAGYYMRRENVGKSVNSNNRTSTISNASSVSAFSNSESNND